MSEFKWNVTQSGAHHAYVAGSFVTLMVHWWDGSYDTFVNNTKAGSYRNLDDAKEAAEQYALRKIQHAFLELEME